MSDTGTSLLAIVIVVFPPLINQKLTFIDMPLRKMGIIFIVWSYDPVSKGPYGHTHGQLVIENNGAV